MSIIEQLKAYIEKRQKDLRAGVDNKDVFTGKQRREMLVAYEENSRTISFLDTLEEPVELEDEVLNREMVGVYANYARPDDIEKNSAEASVHFDKYIARHFFALGQQSKPKEEPVELEKEISKYINARWKFGCVNPITPVYLYDFTLDELKECARHFYNLGKNHFREPTKKVEKSEIPTNLYEAAEEFSKRVAGGHIFRDICVGFKGGAMWDREQGVSMEITEDTKWSEVDLFVHRNCDGMEVIQIRKKDE